MAGEDDTPPNFDGDEQPPAIVMEQTDNINPILEVSGGEVTETTDPSNEPVDDNHNGILVESSNGQNLPVDGELRVEMEPVVNRGIGMVPEIDVGEGGEDGERGDGGGRVGIEGVVTGHSSPDSGVNMPEETTNRGDDNRRDGNGNGPDEQPHVVMVHIQHGSTFKVKTGTGETSIKGPAMVRLVSNNGPPLPLPLQVPPGHRADQIVDQHGVLKNVVLSSEQPQQCVGGQYDQYSRWQQYPRHNGGAPPPSGQYYDGGPYVYPGPNGPYHPSGGPPPTTQPMVYPMVYPSSPPPAGPAPPQMVNHAGQQAPTHPSNNGGHGGSGGGSPCLENGSSPHGGEGPKVGTLLTTEASSTMRYYELLSRLNPIEVVDVKPRVAVVQVEPPAAIVLDLGIIDPSTLNYEFFINYKQKGSSVNKQVYEGEATQITLDAIAPGTEYRVTYLAKLLIRGPEKKDEVVKGRESEPALFTTPPDVPDRPNAPKCGSRNKSAISLKWQAPCDNGSRILSYVLEHDKGAGEGTFEECFKGSAKMSKIVKLSPLTPYTFRLCAVNECGKSDYSELVTFRTAGGAPEIPAPPALQQCSRRTLTLAWTKRPSDHTFKVQMEENGSSGRGDLGFLNVYNGPEATCQMSSLVRSTAYNFRMAVVNQEGAASGYSAVVTYTTQPDVPAASAPPKDVGKIRLGAHRITWEAPEDDGGSEVLSYVVQLTGVDIATETASTPESSKVKGSPSRSSSASVKSTSSSALPTTTTVVYDGPEKECVCSGLKPGRKYTARVAAVSRAGQGAWSRTGTVATAAVAPRAAHSLKLVGKPKSASLTFRWSPPTDTGGAPITQFRAQITPAASTNASDSKEVYLGQAPECTVAGLLPNCSYKLQVKACSKAGDSPWSEPLLVTSGPGCPAAPTDVAARPKSSHMVVISWEKADDNGSAITGYIVETIRVDESSEQVTVPGSSLSHEVSSLTPDTPYIFRVHANNRIGQSGSSEPATCATPPSSPDPMTGVVVVGNPQAESATLQWTMPIANGRPVTSWAVEVTGSSGGSVRPVSMEECRRPVDTEDTDEGSDAEDGEDEDETGIEEKEEGLAQLPASNECSTFVYTVTGLKPSMTYRMRVQAVNSVGAGGFSHSAHLTTSKLPLSPPTLELVSSGSNFARLRWGEGRNVEHIEYTLFMHKKCEDSDVEPTFAQIFRGTALSYRVQKLKENSDYEFQMTATNEAGAGPRSASLRVRTSVEIPNPPRGLEVSKATPSSVTITWQATKISSNDRIRYIVERKANNANSGYVKVCEESRCSAEVSLRDTTKAHQLRVCAVRVSASGKADENLQGQFCEPIRAKVAPSVSEQSVMLVGKGELVARSGRGTKGGPNGAGVSSALEAKKAAQARRDQIHVILFIAAFALLTFLVIFIASYVI